MGYKRAELNDWKKVREMSYYSLIGSHMNPKRLPKSIQKFMPLEGEKKEKTITDEQRNAFLIEAQKYINKKNEQHT
jgi:tryptophan synthase beta subunit